MKKLLWLDDYRNPFDKEVDWMMFSAIGRDVEIHWVKSYDEFTAWIEENGLPDAINFDHDLGEDIAKERVSKGMSKRAARKLKRETLSGFDCTKWLVNYCIDNKKSLPKWYTHSANPVGRDNINAYLTNYNKTHR